MASNPHSDFTTHNAPCQPSATCQFSPHWMSQIIICGGPALWSTIPHHFPIFTQPITQLIVATLNARTASISPFLYQIGFMLASSPLVLHIWTRAMIAGTSSLILMIGLAGSVILMYAWIWPYPMKCLSHACRPASFSNSLITSSNLIGLSSVNMSSSD